MSGFRKRKQERRRVAKLEVARKERKKRLEERAEVSE